LVEHLGEEAAHAGRDAAGAEDWVEALARKTAWVLGFHKNNKVISLLN